MTGVRYMEQDQTSGVPSTSTTQQMDNHPHKRTIGQTVSPNKSTELGSTNSKQKKVEGENCICPICLETIIDCNEQNEGHNAIYCEGEYICGYTDTHSVQICLKWYLSLFKTHTSLFTAPTVISIIMKHNSTI